MSQARSSAVHLQIRLLLFLCFILLLGLAAARIYETTILSEEISAQNELLTAQQEKLEQLENTLANAPLASSTPSSIEDAYAAMESSSSLPETSPENAAETPGPSIGGNDLPSSLADNSVLSDDGMDNLTQGLDPLTDASGLLPPPPINPNQLTEDLIEERLQREQHIGLVAAVEDSIVAIEPLEGIDLFSNDEVLVAREIAGSRELIGKLIITRREQESDSNGQTRTFYIADIHSDSRSEAGKEIAQDDLIFYLGVGTGAAQDLSGL